MSASSSEPLDRAVAAPVDDIDRCICSRPVGVGAPISGRSPDSAGAGCCELRLWYSFTNRAILSGDSPAASMFFTIPTNCSLLIAGIIALLHICVQYHHIHCYHHTLAAAPVVDLLAAGRRLPGSGI